MQVHVSEQNGQYMTKSGGCVLLCWFFVMTLSDVLWPLDLRVPRLTAKGSNRKVRQFTCWWNCCSEKLFPEFCVVLAGVYSLSYKTMSSSRISAAAFTVLGQALDRCAWCNLGGIDDLHHVGELLGNAWLNHPFNTGADLDSSFQ